MVTPMNLNYVRVLTDDFGEMVSFYRDTIGIEPRFVDEANKYAEFNTEGAVLSIFDRQAMERAIGIEDSGGMHECFDRSVIIFRVEDIDALSETLRNKGVVFVTEPMDRPEWTIRTFHIRDPSGNLLEFNQPLNQ